LASNVPWNKQPLFRNGDCLPLGLESGQQHNPYNRFLKKQKEFYPMVRLLKAPFRNAVSALIENRSICNRVNSQAVFEIREKGRPEI
jgi:hypothetical protein